MSKGEPCPRRFAAFAAPTLAWANHGKFSNQPNLSIHPVLPYCSQVFEVVSWLDVLAAKSRFSTWIGGVLPEFTPWDQVFHARSAAALRDIQQQQQQQQLVNDDSRRTGLVIRSMSSTDDESDDEQQQQQQQGRQQQGRRRRLSATGRGGVGGARGKLSGGGTGSSSSSSKRSSRLAAAAAANAVYLHKFSHPLLLAQYLKTKESLERQVRLQGNDDPALYSINRSGGRRFSNRKERVTASDDKAGSSNDGGGQSLRDQLRQLQPPRPVDIAIAPHTSVVVITGPNTGGKTAAVKALGLAVCMAKAGLAVPADVPVKFPCYSAVLADIGDEQSLTANLSTFSGHLQRCVWENVVWVWEMR